MDSELLKIRKNVIENYDTEEEKAKRIKKAQEEKQMLMAQASQVFEEVKAAFKIQACDPHQSTLRFSYNIDQLYKLRNAMFLKLYLMELCLQNGIKFQSSNVDREDPYSKDSYWTFLKELPVYTPAPQKKKKWWAKT